MKRTHYLLLLIISMIFSISGISAQSNTIFTPFVSRIKAESSESSVKISWKDTDNVKGNCILYRHTSPLSPENLSSAVKIARVPQGVEFYEDFPPYTNTNYYYAVFMEDDNSILHEVYIPFRNISSQAAFITEKIKDESPALVTAIKAWAGKDSVELSFKCSKQSAELFIYRNTEPIEDRNDILKANLIATLPGSSSSYTDYPVPGISYYYGIIDSNLIKTGSYNFKAGENITIVPVELEVQSTARTGLPELPSSRPKPLPYLSITRGYQSGRHLSPSVIDSIQDSTEVSAATAVSISSLLKSASEPEKVILEPTILSRDKSPVKGSERAMLADILNTDFSTGNFESALVKLLEFQKIRRDRDIEASVHFYLGQIYYFLGEYKSSFTEFLFAEEYCFMETRPWINTLYRKLRIHND